MLGSVMLHLIRNAWQAIEGSGLMQITTFQKKSTTSYSAIKDTGPGIAPENIDRIFSPFFTTKEEREWAWLSYWTRTRIIRTHNRQIEAKIFSRLWNTLYQ
jgi:nitrogen-specific signal transduction histidine kinase